VEDLTTFSDSYREQTLLLTAFYSNLSLIFPLRARGGVDPPDPIPNSEVKHASADGSWGAAPCKSRSVRGGYLYRRGLGSGPAAFSYRGSRSAGRALPCQGRCREFESRLPLHVLRARR